MKYQQAVDKLAVIKQSHILKHWNGLNDDQKSHLLDQIDKLDISMFSQLQHVAEAAQTTKRNITPFNSTDSSGNVTDAKKGLELISSGKVGCLIVAGGQGTRLRFDGPKGMFPVTPVKHKSLFQLFAEKTIAAGKQVDRLLPVAIMTSPLNHQVTVDFFKQNRLFGLQQSQISFFSQEMLPFLDQEKNLFLEAPDTIAQGPDGNGGALHHFYNQGLWQEWHDLGIEYINFILVDNPLADPFDAELIGFHHRTKNDVIIKCMPRVDPKESLGVLAIEDGKTVVVEYTEISESDRTAVDSKGSLLYGCANLSLFSFSMDFIRQIAKEGLPMPLHKAFKSASYLNDQGVTVSAKQPIAWKFEKFIFDVLERTEKVQGLLYPRDACFSPLKNFSGPASIDTVKKDLQKSDQLAFSKVSDINCTTTPFEVSSEFHYPTPQLLKKWRGKSPSTNYVE